MKKIFTILGLLIAFTIHAQNWSPILTSQKMNYQHSDSAYITNTIWVDSVEIDNNDSLFYLNRIVKDVPDNPEIVLRNQAQFLSKTLIKQEGGVYLCTDPFDYLLLTKAGSGDTWNFTNSISAEVTNITQDDVFGIQDSVKTISLSDGNEIRLSKNFGIIKFPDFENGGYYELVGIQDTELGESVPGFWEIYDFEVGDVFQLNRQESSGMGSYNFTEKIRIDSKEVLSTGFDYYTYIIRSGEYYDPVSNEYYQLIYDYYSDFYFLDSTSIAEDSFNNELVKLADISETPDIFYSRTKFFLDSLGIPYRSIGNNTQNGSNPHNLYQEQSPENDTLLSNNIWIDEGLVYIEFQQNLGVVYYDYYADEASDDYHMEGYIINGDTIGIITPDSILLLVGIKDITINNNIFILYPNPCKNKVNFKTNAEEIAFPIKLELRNIHGLIVKETLISTKEGQVDISQISEGIYFYTIKSGNKIMQSGKLVVQ